MAGITVGVGTRDRRGYSSAGRPARPAPARATRPMEPTLKPRNANEFVLALEEVSRGIRDPVAKLRYIRSSLARYQQADRCLRAVPFARLRQLLYRLLSLEGLRHLLSTNPMGAPVPVDTSTRRSIRRAGLGAVAALGVLAIGLVVAGFRVTREAATPVAVSTPRPPLPAVAESLPPLPAGVAPASVWLVEETDRSEHYSNGLRIDTTFSTAGEGRRRFEGRATLGGGKGIEGGAFLLHSHWFPLRASGARSQGLVCCQRPTQSAGMTCARPAMSPR